MIDTGASNWFFCVETWNHFARQGLIFSTPECYVLLLNDMQTPVFLLPLDIYGDLNLFPFEMLNQHQLRLNSGENRPTFGVIPRFSVKIARVLLVVPTPKKKKKKKKRNERKKRKKKERKRKEKEKKEKRKKKRKGRERKWREKGKRKEIKGKKMGKKRKKENLVTHSNHHHRYHHHLPPHHQHLRRPNSLDIR